MCCLSVTPLYSKVKGRPRAETRGLGSEELGPESAARSHLCTRTRFPVRAAASSASHTRAFA